MTVFLSGGTKSGKSSLAQDIAVKLAREGKRYYVATMIPTDGEDRERIRRHIEDRDGMGFETIECGTGILSCLEQSDKSGVFLLDSVTALLMNELFPPERNYEMDIDAPARCARELLRFAESVSSAVFVSDYVYSDAAVYDPVTENYCRGLALIDRALARVCDTVIEMSAGSLTVHKGELPL